MLIILSDNLLDVILTYFDYSSLLHCNKFDLCTLVYLTFTQVI